MVRAELMEQIPHIAMLCREHQNLFPTTIQDYILPTVVRYLTDTNNQVWSKSNVYTVPPDNRIQIIDYRTKYCSFCAVLFLLDIVAKSV